MFTSLRILVLCFATLCKMATDLKMRFLLSCWLSLSPRKRSKKRGQQKSLCLSLQLLCGKGWLFPTSDLRVKSDAAWGSLWGRKQTRKILLLAPSHKQVTAEEIWRVESCRKLLPDKSWPSEPTRANSSRLLLHSPSGPKESLSLYQLLKSSLHINWGHA